MFKPMDGPAVSVDQRLFPESSLYGPACLTAVGTMSSAAILAVALRCVRKSGVLLFGQDGTGLMLAIFALQDNFGITSSATGH